MKPFLITAGLGVCLTVFLAAAEPPVNEDIAKHREGASKVADDQDELKADVQQLVTEQTVPKVMELLGQVEDIMIEVTDHLSDADTGGFTIAAQTEIIEKIHEAAKQKQQQGQGGKSGGAMMEMMERMMGKTPDGDGQGKGKGEKPGDKGGQGQTGESDTGNDSTLGSGGGKSEVRRVPKAAGSTDVEIPEEFRKAFDAYNRGVEKKIK